MFHCEWRLRWGFSACWVLRVKICYSPLSLHIAIKMWMTFLRLFLLQTLPCLKITREYDTQDKRMLYTLFAMQSCSFVERVTHKILPLRYLIVSYSESMGSCTWTISFFGTYGTKKALKVLLRCLGDGVGSIEATLL